MACLGLSSARMAAPRLFITPRSSTIQLSQLTRTSRFQRNVALRSEFQRSYFKSRKLSQEPPYPTYFNPPQQPPSPPPRQSRFIWRFIRGTTLFAFGLFIGSTMSIFTFPFAAMLNATQRGSRDTFEGAEAIEQALFANPLVKKLVDDKTYIMSRPNKTFPEAIRKYSLTANTLMGPGKFEVPAVVFTKPDGSDAIAIYYLGGEMCGWPSFVHGGLIATILDEGLARTGFLVLPNKVGMTAMLKIDYRSPCKANQFVVLRSRTTEHEGRKSWVKGEIYELTYTGDNGKLIAEANGLFVEPKGAFKLLGPVSEQLNRINQIER